MFKVILKILKRLVFSFCLLYSFNVIGSSLNMIIPINYFSIITTSFLGIPGLIGLIAVKMIIY